MLDFYKNKSISFSPIVYNVVTIIVFNLLLIASAKFKVPFYPVSITLQTFAVLTLSMAFGWKKSVIVVGLYLFEGLIGLPVFSGTPEKGIGIAYLLGPTGGYLLGFLPAAFITGYLAEYKWDQTIIKSFLAMIIGHIIIYVPGLMWLGIIFGWSMMIFEYGLYPFIVGDVFKSTVGALIIWSAAKFALK